MRSRSVPARGMPPARRPPGCSGPGRSACIWPGSFDLGRLCLSLPPRLDCQTEPLDPHDRTNIHPCWTRRRPSPGMTASSGRGSGRWRCVDARAPTRAPDSCSRAHARPGRAVMIAGACTPGPTSRDGGADEDPLHHPRGRRTRVPLWVFGSLHSASEAITPCASTPTRCAPRPGRVSGVAWPVGPTAGSTEPWTHVKRSSPTGTGVRDTPTSRGSYCFRAVHAPFVHRHPCWLTHLRRVFGWRFFTVKSRHRWP